MSIIKMNKVIEDVKCSSRMHKLWLNFQEKSPYAKGIEYQDLFQSLEYIALLIKDSKKVQNI